MTATPASGHTITGYQWYDNGTTNGNSGGTVISGATDASYAIPTGKAVGTYYYYCVVTTERTDNSQTATTTSNAIAVTVAAPVASVTVGETTTNYTAFSDALSAWEDGSTLTLLDDVTTASTITVSGTKTLDLNGCGVRMTGSGRVFEVPSGATLTINDSGSSRVHYVTLTNWRGAAVSDTGTESDVTDGSGVVKVTGGYITGGYITSYNGSALHVSGTLNLVKGTVIGNKSTGAGGAIAVESRNSIFTMSGGEICYNDGQSAGGVRVWCGRMDMSGGTIHHNYAYNTSASDPGKGGGIQLDGGDCSFTMTGGSIEYNTAYFHAGGLALYDGSATISGGSIVNNQAGDRACNHGWNGGGVYVHTSASLTVSGNTVITGNKKGETTNNVYLAEDRKITVGDELTGTIGVTMQNPGVFTNSTDTSLNNPFAFKSDNSAYTVGKDASGQLELANQPRFSSVALELGGVLNLRFYVSYPSTWDTTDDKVEFTVNGVSSTVTYAASGTDSNGRYFACPVYAFQMADSVTAVYKHGDTTIDTVTDYSVKQNLDALKDTTTGTTQALVQATMDFGSYIQPYLSARNGWTLVDDPAAMTTGTHLTMTPYTASLTPLNAADIPDGYSYTMPTSEGEVDKVYFYLSTYEDNKLEVLVDLADDVTGTVTGTVNGKPFTPEAYAGSGPVNAYKLTLDHISASALATAFPFTLSVDRTKKLEFSASALSYVKIVLPQAANDTQALALTALYNYALAAQAYTQP